MEFTLKEVHIFRRDINRILRLRIHLANILLRIKNKKEQNILVRMHNKISSIYWLESNEIDSFNTYGPKLYITREKERKFWAKII